MGFIEVFVDNVSRGTITQANSDVECGAGEVNVILPEGDHQFEARGSQGGLWSSTLTWTEGKCKRLKLTNNSNTNDCQSLDGIWERRSDGVCSGCAGMTIQVSNGVGSITNVSSTNEAGFYAGQIKFKDFNTSDCTLNELMMPVGNYTPSDVNFTSATSVSIGGNTYDKQ